MNWVATLHPTLAACPFRHQRAGKTDEETGLVDTKVSSQLGNESSRASTGALLSPAGSSSWTLHVSVFQHLCLTRCIEAVLRILVNLMQRTREFSFSGGSPLQAQLPCFLGRVTHTPELPWGTIHSAATFLKSLPEVPAWLAFSHAPVVPPRVLPSQGINWGSLFQSLCLVRLPNSANKDTVHSNNKIKISHM